jgi:glutamate--cysteine ligase
MTAKLSSGARGSTWQMQLAAEVDRSFAPSRRDASFPWIGAELELISVTEELRPRAADPRVLAEGFDRRFVAAAHPRFEPGGQLELRPAPEPTVAGVVTTLQVLAERATAIAAARGIRFVPAGVNPWLSCADVPMWTSERRFVEMQRLFDEVGHDGRRMMRLTAALQVTVDLLPGAAGLEQWIVANLAAPLLSDSYANSPHLDGHAVRQGARTRIWHGVDLTRTGYDLRYVDAVDPVRAYAAFAAQAPRLDLPEAADPKYHLTTLFPPVRPRGGFLELRFLDAQPLERLDEAVTAVAVLLGEKATRRTALDLLLRGAATAADIHALVSFGRGRLPAGYLQ